jgi:hypothetical protein
MSVSGAGILPYAYFNNTIYFLFGREHLQSGWSGSGTLADFGGAVEDDHINPATLAEFGATASEVARVAAAIEFWEETMGLFYTKKEAYTMLKQQNGLMVKNGGYAEHLMKIDYNPYWVELFTNAWNYVMSCAVAFNGTENKKEAYGKKGVAYHIPSCPDGYTEKTEIKWVKYEDLKAHIEMGSSEKYRPELISTMKLIFANKDFKKLLDEASIFKNPDQVGFVAPIVAEPILPAPVVAPSPKVIAPTGPDTWPAFYPKPPYTAGLVTSLQSHYQYLLANLPGIAQKPNFAPLFSDIDQINQYHYELKQYIYLKTISGAGAKNEAPVMPLASWKNDYCPLSDDSTIHKKLGQGANGSAYLITTKVKPICCKDPLKFVVKIVPNQASSGESELNNIGLDTPFAKDVIPTKKTNIYATEVGSLSMVNHLITHSKCYNFPYFYGTAKCNEDGQHYMYMQASGGNFHNTSLGSGEFAATVLQGLMGIRAMYSIRLVHGDINTSNLAYQTVSAFKQPVYKYGGEYYIGSPTNHILHFIDFGFGFIKDKLESTSRIQKDKTRVNINVNWDNNPNLKELNEPSHMAYKGFYVAKPDQADAAYIRRHLLDLYQFYDTLAQKISATNMVKFTSVRDYFMQFFANPYYYSKNYGVINPIGGAKPPTNADSAISEIWNGIFSRLVTSGAVTKLSETEFLKITDLKAYMFLGDLDVKA